MRSVTGSGLFWAFLLIGVAAYFLPTIVGLVRKVDGLGFVTLLNLLGWVGWPTALILAFGPRRAPPPPPMPTYVFPPPVIVYTPLMIVYPCQHPPCGPVTGQGPAPVPHKVITVKAL